jgi:hypothetical protein
MLHDFPDTLPPGALGGASEAIPEIPFDPVPRLRRRRKGWSEERQRDFIRALSKCASVAAAARSVGMTPRSAYRLADAPGADSFVEAWDIAIDLGMTHMRFDGLDRSLNGSFVPVYRRGKLVQVEHRRNDRLAIAILGGRQTTADDLRRSAMSRREHRMDLAELDAAREVNKAAHKAADDALRAEVDRLVGRIEENRARRYGPRITRL